ncbi:hypothetical protein O9993_01905 [Vibrio lentus]|nr:hypothetical protein [Vibrio lentus]
MVLFFLTNDGDIVNKDLAWWVTITKKSTVCVDKPIYDGILEEMASGVPYFDTSLPCRVMSRKRLSFLFRITLTQGL